MQLSANAKSILDAVADRYISYLQQIAEAVENLPENPAVIDGQVMIPAEQYQALIKARTKPVVQP